MKVSAEMVEAGITRLAKVRKLDDASLVAAIYSAMEQHRLVEAARDRLNAPKGAYVHQDFPAWRFGPNGESKIFQRAEDVPEGWGDSTQVHTLERDSEVLEGKLDRKLKRKVAA